MDELEAIMAKLDRDTPRWVYDWASQSDLADHAQRPDLDKLRKRTARGLIVPILNAAIAAGVVILP